MERAKRVTETEMPALAPEESCRLEGRSARGVSVGADDPVVDPEVAVPEFGEANVEPAVGIGATVDGPAEGDDVGTIAPDVTASEVFGELDVCVLED